MLEKGAAESAEFLGTSEEVADNNGTAVQTGVDFVNPAATVKNVASEAVESINKGTKSSTGDVDIVDVRDLRGIPEDKNAVAVARANIPGLDQRYEGYAPQVPKASNPKFLN